MFSNYHLLYLVTFSVLCWRQSWSEWTLEDEFQTEIVRKNPRDFTENKFVLLSVRQVDFDRFHYNNSGQITEGKVGQTDIVKAAFWYQYGWREPTRICPTLPRGISAYTDWSLLIPCLFTATPEICPRTIFVHTLMLNHFAENTLAKINSTCRFVLITAGCDYTVPTAHYNHLRFNPPGLGSSAPGSLWTRLLEDDRIVHWFAENHDMNAPKLSTLPTGLLDFYTVDPVLFREEDLNNHRYMNGNVTVPVQERPLKFYVSDRARDGKGFLADRGWIRDKCKTSSLCVSPDGEHPGGVDHNEFLNSMAKFPFITCVHGGGIDPSPKAFEAMLVGTIPIIQHSTLDDGYNRFPVMFVNEWSELFTNNTEALLKEWLVKLAPYYEENSYLRRKSLERLKSSYWLEVFHEKLDAYDVRQIRTITHPNHTHHHHGSEDRRHLRH